MPAKNEKTCTYDVTKAKSQYYDAQKKHIFDDYLLKSQYYDAKKYWKKHVFKTFAS